MDISILPRGGASLVVRGHLLRGLFTAQRPVEHNESEGEGREEGGGRNDMLSEDPGGCDGAECRAVSL